MTDILIREAQYVDARASSDKYYRVFAFGQLWASQYGRNGTAGTFTAVVDAGSPDKAIAAAERKFAEKVKKGYQIVASGTVVVGDAPAAIATTTLDRLAQALPVGSTPASQTIVAPDLAAVAVPAVRDDLTAVVATTLDRLGDGRAATPADLRPTLSVRPMLASETFDDELQRHLETDDEWIAQHKYDGDRAVIEVVDGELRVLNRQGEQKVRGVSQDMLEPFTALHSGRWVFDGEIVGRTLVVFDLLCATDSKSTWVEDGIPFSNRYRTLTALSMVIGVPMVVLAPEDAPVVLAPIATTAAAKSTMLQDAIDRQREGLVLRHRAGRYEQGRRSTTLLKYKLVKDADVVVASQHASKQSVSLAVHSVDGTITEVGQASTIGKGEVRVGEIWVVRYLYVVEPDHPRLVQPRLMRRRDDKSAAECTIDQFTHAGTARIV